LKRASKAIWNFIFEIFSQKPKAKSQKPKAKSQKPKAFHHRGTESTEKTRARARELKNGAACTEKDWMQNHRQFFFGHGDGERDEL
jgi:hypothetical protein